MKAVLLDIGGTLWPDVIADDPERPRRVKEALGLASGNRAVEVAVALEEAAMRELENVPSNPEQDTLGLVQTTLGLLGVRADRQVANRVRRAMIPTASPNRFFAGAREFLSQLHETRTRVVAVSNTFWRSSEDYARDFERAGVLQYFEAIITSFDEGVRKPDLRIFRSALRLARADTADTVVIGNSERMDIEPAVRLGIRSVLVAIEVPLPSGTAAHAVVTSLDELADLIRSWAYSEQTEP